MKFDSFYPRLLIPDSQKLHLKSLVQEELGKGSGISLDATRCRIPWIESCYQRYIHPRLSPPRFGFVAQRSSVLITKLTTSSFSARSRSRRSFHSALAAGVMNGGTRSRAS